MMIACKLFVISGLAVGALAFPLAGNVTRTIKARAPSNTPSIASGFSARQTQQIQDGFQDAFELASYVRSISSSTVDPIFSKYFNTADRATVDSVMDTILGGDPANPPGNPLLTSISVVPDYADSDGDLACDGETMGELRDWNTDNPKIVLCDPGAFGHGGIGKGYNDDLSTCDPNTDTCTVNAVICERLDPRVSWKMETIGSILLHEYTHWLKLMTSPNGPLSKETDDYDDNYGPTGVRALDKTLATNSADSYSWFATEVLWTVLCQTDYADPTAADDDDPNCDDTACKATKGP